jgi:hypothetical protein
MKRDLIKNINIRVDGELFTINLDSEFRVDEDNAQELPINLAFLVGLQGRLMTSLNKARRERDKFFAKRFMLIKEDPINGKAQSDEWVKQEIEDEEEYQDLRLVYDNAQEYYTIVKGLITAYQEKVNLLRTIAADRRKEMDYS